MNLFRTLLILTCSVFLVTAGYSADGRGRANKMADTTKIDREYTLETTMLGYFGTDGTRNPVLKAKKGERVRINIVNGELMTHDIALEKLKIKSKGLVEKGSKASITFTANVSDTYYCTVPGHRMAGMEGKFEVVSGNIVEQATVAGQLPKKDGKSLNLNFEKGTLEDWTATGEAFAKPLVSEDPSPLHQKDMHIGIAGKYFVTSGGTKNYKATGTLTSVKFKVTQPWAAFRISGGALVDARVELVNAADDKVFFKMNGAGRSTLQPVVVDLQAMLNKEMYIRIVDKETGISTIPYIADDIWAHVNFDDFLFYPSRPQFSNELKPEDVVPLPPLDVTRYAGLDPQKAAEAMTGPKGFKFTLAAAEPDVNRPISFAIDYRGRLWVAEAHTYPNKAPEGKGRDRILIFEDTDGDGKLDSRKVFIEGLNLVSGIEVGLGGVWVGQAPYLLFIPIDAKTDKPAGPTQTLLDGWGMEDTHETINNLRWGPDGWLYGCHGVFTQSNVGAPGAPADQRQRVNAGIWRYHPVTKKFEVFAEGTSNPWGVDWNDYGQAFATACVIEHMYHVIQGARYIRQYGDHVDPYTYDDIKTIADHVHWVGNRGPHAGNGRSGSKGGGHAHAGALVYLGENWPAEYRNNIFMNNIHGSRVNEDILVRKGSGYVAEHGPDFVFANDSWSQWLNFRTDQAGSVFAIDWYDKNQCHSPNPDVHDTITGRIFKISYEKDVWKKVDLSKLSSKELVEQQLNKNEFYVTQSRLLLQQRGKDKKVYKALKTILNDNPDVTRKLRALWALQATGGNTEKDLLKLLDNQSEWVRAWAIQFLAEGKNPSDDALKRFAQLAKSDTSAVVRLYLTSAIQRTAVEKRWDVLDALYQHSEDKNDHNLPLMIWYAAEPNVKADPNRAIEMAMKTQLPNMLAYTVRRIGAINTPESKQTLLSLNERLEKSADMHQYHNIMMLIKKITDQK
jgi:putative membrane-bound dehydrogenase-like protein